MYIYKCVYVFGGKKFYFGIEIRNVTDLLQLVLQGISIK